LGESGVLLTLDPGGWIGDKGYVGNGMITPIKNPAGRELLDWEKEFNKQINKIRYVIEQVIANFKTWRIMHTDYRRPIETPFTAAQLRFLNELIDYLAHNGTIDVDAIYEAPFNTIAPRGPEDIFTEADISAMVMTMDSVKATAIPA
jgi:DDE superfamily endonuclease/EcoEI R protein